MADGAQQQPGRPQCRQAGLQRHAVPGAERVEVVGAAAARRLAERAVAARHQRLEVGRRAARGDGAQRPAPFVLLVERRDREAPRVGQQIERLLEHRAALRLGVEQRQRAVVQGVVAALLVDRALGRAARPRIARQPQEQVGEQQRHRRHQRAEGPAGAYGALPLLVLAPGEQAALLVLQRGDHRLDRRDDARTVVEPFVDGHRLTRLDQSLRVAIELEALGERAPQLVDAALLLCVVRGELQRFVEPQAQRGDLLLALAPVVGLARDHERAVRGLGPVEVGLGEADRAEHRVGVAHEVPGPQRLLRGAPRDAGQGQHRRRGHEQPGERVARQRGRLHPCRSLRPFWRRGGRAGTGRER